jgi:hypothetical protein
MFVTNALSVVMRIGFSRLFFATIATTAITIATKIPIAMNSFVLERFARSAMTSAYVAAEKSFHATIAAVRRAFVLLAIFAIANAALAEERLSPPIVITGVFPSFAPPEGGWIVRISGYGFAAPARVFFELDDLKAEAVVVSISANAIDVVTPSVSLGSEQIRVASIAVESRGFRATASDAFTFERAIQEPRIATVSPSTGPESGETRAYIYGEGFQAPVHVLFGTVEARVFTVERTHVVVETPASRGGLHTVDVTVRNINSGTSDTLEDAYRYVRDVAISSVAPNHGPAGTKITIDGSGFHAPVAVHIAGISAQVLSVTGTQIVAILPDAPDQCTPLTGSVTVYNVDDGSFAFGGDFTVEVEPLAIVNVTPRNGIAGKTIDVQLAREGDYEFLIGGARAWIVERNGTTYRIRVPKELSFPTTACTSRGVQGTAPTASRFYLHVVDRNGHCAITDRNRLTIAPAQPVPCTLPASVKVLPRTCTSRTVAFANDIRRADLVITAPEGVEPRTAVIRAGETKQFVLPVTPRLERLRFHTNDPQRPWLLVCVSP